MSHWPGGWFRVRTAALPSVAAVLALATACTQSPTPIAGESPGDSPILFLPAPTDAASPHGALGISPGSGVFDLDDADLNRELSLWQTRGVRYLRIDINFAVVGVAPVSRDWSAPDRVIGAARAHDLEVIGLLTYAPGWAVGPASTQSGAQPDPQAFGAFAGESAERYGVAIDVWEIWNEPNSAAFWGARPDAGAYMNLLAGAADSIRRHDSHALVLSGGLARGVKDGPTLISPRTFLRQLYDRGLAELVDGVAVHPYSYPALPSSRGSPFQELPALRRLMVANGADRALLWVTEFGAPTGTSDRAVSEERQYRILSDAIAVGEAWPWLGPLLVFSGRDRGSDPDDPEQNFGVITVDYRAKPALSVLRPS